MAPDENETRTVPVEVRDPDLSERANEVMTREAQAALGTDRVELPAEQADRAGHAHPREKSALAALWERRMLIGVGAAAGLVVAGILVLATGSWWWILLPLGLHFLTTALVVASAIDSTTMLETPSPTALAALEDEGVRDAERVFGEHVQSFTPTEPEGGESVVEHGDNVRTTRPHEDQPRATGEQETAMTPSSAATQPAPAEPGQGGADVPEWPVLIPAVAAAVLMLAAVVIPLVAGGGLLWLMVPVVWPLAAALIAYDVIAFRRARAASGSA